MSIWLLQLRIQHEDKNHSTLKGGGEVLSVMNVRSNLTSDNSPFACHIYSTHITELYLLDW